MLTEYHYTTPSAVEIVITDGVTRIYPWHLHAKHWTIGLICSGIVHLKTRASEQRIPANGHFSIPPGTVHALQVESHTRLAVLCFDMTQYSEFIMLDALDQLGQTLSREQKNSLQTHALDILKSTTGKVLYPVPIQTAVNLLMEKPEESFSIDYLAKLAGYSPWHFLRLFQKETGLTPHAFQLICRLRKLRNLLRTKQHMAESAPAAGFFDQSHMHKAFRYYHGLTPRQFQKASIKLTPQ